MECVVSNCTCAECDEAFDMAIKALEQEPICPSHGIDCEDCPAYDPCEDAISRQAVKDWFCTNYCSEHNKCEHFENGDCNAMTELYAIPSAKPQEPKTVQEKQAESEKYQKAFDDGYENGYAQARFDYEQRPKTGHWIMIDEELQRYKCSECGEIIRIYDNETLKENYRFSHCGAQMKESEEV